MPSRATITLLFLIVATVALAIVDLFTGSSPLSPAEVWGALSGSTDVSEHVSRVVIDIRLIKVLSAILAGCALGVSGLEMQTLFRNPLAGPYVLGVSAGASLGVALMMLGVSALGLTAVFSTATAAWIGSAAVLGFIAVVSRRTPDVMVILILGMMFSSGVGAVVEILQYLSGNEALKSYVVWTMGSLSDVTWPRLALMGPAVIIGLILAFIAVKPLNLLLLGETYALSMGLDIRRSRLLIFTSTILLAGTVTAYCGPIGFLGLAMPHVARMIIRQSDHRILLPATMLCSAATLTLCDIATTLLLLPLNAMTSLVGIPIVIWIVLRNRMN